MNYSDMPTSDPKAGKAREVADEDRKKEARLSKPMIGIIVICACVLVALCVILGINHATGGDRPQTTGDAITYADGSQPAEPDDKADASATPISSETGDLTDSVDLEVTPDKDNGMSAGGIAADVEKATLAKDQGGHGWVTATIKLSNPGTDSITLGDNGLELLASQDGKPLAWNSDDLSAWNQTQLAGSESKEIQMRFALADTSAPLTLAVVRNDATLGWTVTVQGHADGIVPLGVAA